MSVAATGGAAAPEPVLDPESYTLVTIVKTGEVGDHVYRRGSKHHVDGTTLAALKAAGMLLETEAAAR